MDSDALWLRSYIRVWWKVMVVYSWVDDLSHRLKAWRRWLTVPRHSYQV